MDGGRELTLSSRTIPRNRRSRWETTKPRRRKKKNRGAKTGMRARASFGRVQCPNGGVNHCTAWRPCRATLMRIRLCVDRWAARCQRRGLIQLRRVKCDSCILYGARNTKTRNSDKATQGASALSANRVAEIRSNHKRGNGQISKEWTRHRVYSRPHSPMLFTNRNSISLGTRPVNLGQPVGSPDFSEILPWPTAPVASH